MLKVFPAVSLIDTVDGITILSLAITQLEVCKKWLERVGKMLFWWTSLDLYATIIFLGRPLMDFYTRKISCYGDLWKLKDFIHFPQVDKTGH